MKTEVEVVQNQQVAITPDQMIMKAIEKGLDIDQLDKLMQLQERWEAKNAKKAYDEAMSEFQKNKPDLFKTKKVSFNSKAGGRVEYNYNPLPKIQKAIDPILGELGISYKWDQKTEGGKIRVRCVPSHVDGHSEPGEWLEGDADTSGTKNSIQATGSTISFLKRYTIEGAFGLSSDEDDDGIKSPKKKDLPTPNANQWGRILEKFKTGEVTADKISENFNLSKEQAEELKALIG